MWWRPHYQLPPITSWEPIMSKVTPFLWYDSEAEEAARFYVSIFPNSNVGTITRYGSAGPGAEGSVMTVEFVLDGQPFIALNGGPHFQFNEAVSFSIDCDRQAEVDDYWSRLSEGGEEGPCGWLKDRFGLSWQVNPARLGELLRDSDRARSQRVMTAMLKMKKIDIAELERAAANA
jgi:predicted 3-demethylubiquinone-9 3-methyltransferase (glyoxalase superfamily)